MEYSGPSELYVDGAWTDAVSGETLQTFDPATETEYATVALAGEEDVRRAVDAASRAAERGSEWTELDPAERGAALRRMADAIEERKDEITLVESHDNGKTPFEAGMEVQMVIDTFRYFAGWTDKLTGEHNPVPGDRLNYTTREPLGVTGHIVPWNYPFQLAGRSLAPALACGNTAVVKPSSQTPLSALYYGLAAEEAGLPDGVVNVIPGSGSEAGAALAEHDDVAHVAFTGSTEIGKRVMADAAQNVTGVTLELGGKGPHLVFPEADLGAAAKGIHYGIFMNAGQMCWAGSRLLVHEDVADDLVERVVEGAESTPLGSGIDDDGRMGPVVSEDQREQILDYIQTGVDEGATVACGGGVPEDKESGYFVEPTVLTDVTNDMTVAREEIFGPVLSVIEFSDEEEAIELANDSPYGLLSGIWTEQLSRAHRVADALDYGMVSVNEYPVTFPQTPFGGTKESGNGREQGLEAVREYTQTKNVNVKLD
ncbi:aldehyde dehydrogenase (acceptor) [Halogeometricum borinquense DSM 11551]|uniref:Aldehyde dehydrogenase (Acceptor) n=2 Tax=Halogeometricum borinquense TaxID=60847 RepID=E4NWB9_HALBP|nr:aldehyde dehydrogenase family protein [Halogeometricum borinquense]ADQ69339.1 aldehyde dehydrogenase (acceptor) [Halogeometricum borinquense DSM 11551]ELY26230.1 aldehyde dehydrogenase (acceptor) [Halogeometricum borinquense DSM 11551]